MENPIKMDDLGVPLFSETPICFRDPRIFKIKINFASSRCVFDRRIYLKFLGYIAWKKVSHWKVGMSLIWIWYDMMFVVQKSEFMFPPSKSLRLASSRDQNCELQLIFHRTDGSLNSLTTPCSRSKIEILFKDKSWEGLKRCTVGSKRRNYL